MEKLRCLKCGKLAACSCGVPYVSKLEYAMAHMKLNKSNGANAKELGMSRATVERARNQLPQKEATESKRKRKGADGKMYSGRPRGRPRRPINGDGKTFSLREGDSLRGKAREQYMEEWAKHDYDNRLIPRERWEISLDYALKRIVALEKEWEERRPEFTLTNCTAKLLSNVVAALNGMLSARASTHDEENSNVIRH